MFSQVDRCNLSHPLDQQLRPCHTDCHAVAITSRQRLCLWGCCYALQVRSDYFQIVDPNRAPINNPQPRRASPRTPRNPDLDLQLYNTWKDQVRMFDMRMKKNLVICEWLGGLPIANWPIPIGRDYPFWYIESFEACEQATEDWLNMAVSATKSHPVGFVLSLAHQWVTDQIIVKSSIDKGCAGGCAEPRKLEC